MKSDLVVYLRHGSPHAVAAACGLTPSAVWGTEGQESTVSPRSLGFSLPICRKEHDCAGELVTKLGSFLDRHRAELSRLRDHGAVDRLWVYVSVHPNGLGFNLAFPRELVRLAGDLGLGIVVTRLPTSAADPAAAADRPRD